MSLPFFYNLREVITNAQISASRSGKVVGVVTFLLTNVEALRIDIGHSSSSGEEIWRCRSSSFRVACFTTLKKAYLYQVSEYIKPFGYMAMSERTAREGVQVGAPRTRGSQQTTACDS